MAFTPTSAHIRDCGRPQPTGEAATVGGRQRLARELHDNVIHTLSLMRLLSHGLPAALEPLRRHIQPGEINLYVQFKGCARRGTVIECALTLKNRS